MSTEDTGTKFQIKWLVEVILLENSISGTWELGFSDSKFSIFSILLCFWKQIKIITIIMVLKVWSKLRELCFFRERKIINVIKWLITRKLENMGKMYFIYLFTFVSQEIFLFPLFLLALKKLKKISSIHESKENSIVNLRYPSGVYHSGSEVENSKSVSLHLCAQVLSYPTLGYFEATLKLHAMYSR